MRALIANCTLKSSPERSNTEALLDVVADAPRGAAIDVDVVRVVDHDVKPGVTNDEGDGDEWPQLLTQVRAAETVVIATPTWLGQPSSVAKRVLERMDALISDHKHDWSEKTWRTVASNLAAATRAVHQSPNPTPPG